MLVLPIAALSISFWLQGTGLTAPAASLCGTVQDQTGAPLTGAAVHLASASLAYDAISDASGEFCFANLEPGDYRLAVQLPDFRTSQKDLVLRAAATIQLTVVLKLASVNQQVTVAEGAADAASLNVAQTEIGASLMQNLPSESANAALSSILTLATPGLAADSNGVFHPLGEHAETSFSVDGQLISDQQSRIFSNQISAATLEGIRTLQGAPPAEYGDKTSLIVELTTRSGLDAGKTNGTVSAGYGSFATPTAAFALAFGSSRIGNFVSLDAFSSSRFLDSPEFEPLHAIGNAETLFDRFDWRPSPVTALHANVSAARSWFQVPNTYDQQSVEQDQRQNMTSFNLALALSRVLSPSLVLTANTWVRQDRVGYFPSANAFADRPATLSQSRRLTSTGFRSDLAYSHGRHNAKLGIQLQVTPLAEAFSTGLTDPAFNSPCTDRAGVPLPDPSLTAPTQCAAAGYLSNPGFQPALLPYDLSRAGTLFRFRGRADIYEGSAYIQDSIRFGRLHLNLGLRYDQYAGLSSGFGIEPRAGVTYQALANTLLHFSYARIFLTPYNENLVLSSSTGPGGLANGSLGASAVHPLSPARRNQFNAGWQQQLGGRFNMQAQYFWKLTSGAYDFNTILNTPLNFPIQFRQSKIDGVLIRATLNNWHGLSAFTVMGHSRSRLFSPEIGGINFGTAYAPVARPDHDQDFEQTTNIQYQFAPKRLRGLWMGATWRFDSGLVVVSVPDYATALTLTGDEQQEMGLYCGADLAKVTRPLRTCSSPSYGATRIQIAAPGSYDPDTNPSRISPRNLLDVALGTDSLWKKDSYSVGGKLTVVNLTNRTVLYNFLSSFSGTHFVSPRAIQAEMTFHF